jgi:hypothetical protein
MPTMGAQLRTLLQRLRCYESRVTVVVGMESVAPSGWSLGMHLVALGDGGVLVHSPTWFGEETFARVDAVGEPRVLFAPNHFHYLSLARFVERYPKAIVVAGEGAAPRIAKRSEVEPRAAGSGLVPPGVRFLECAGTKTGETWLSFTDDDGSRAWLVCDAFFHVTRPVTGMTGFILKSLGTLPGLCIGNTFRWLSVRDVATYRAWALDAIARERPRRMYMSHGEPVEGEDLPERLTELVKRRLT